MTVSGEKTNRLPIIRPWQLWEGREAKIWLAALLVSLSIHGLLFRWHLTGPSATVSCKLKTRVTRISFRTLAPPRQQPPILARKTEAPVKPLVQPPRPHPRPALKPTLKKIVRAEPDIRPEPLAKVEPVPPKTPPADKPPSEPSPPVPAAKITAELPAPVDMQAMATARQLYIQELFASIEAHKFYPTVARRRRLEGQVQVSFTVQANGDVSDLHASDGQPLLEEAAKKTVQRSLPLPSPEGRVGMPLTISYHMDFRLH
jgi:protein TonB